MTPKCPHDPKDLYFDRSICPEPCGSMHYFCGACGEVQDTCLHDTEFTAYEGSSVVEALLHEEG